MPDQSYRVTLPETDEQWQRAVDAAKFLLVLDAARQYGLVVGGPAVNVERCLYMLEQGLAALAGHRG